VGNIEEIKLDGYILRLHSAGKGKDSTYSATICDEIGAFSVAMDSDLYRAIGQAVMGIPEGAKRRLKNRAGS